MQPGEEIPCNAISFSVLLAQALDWIEAQTLAEGNSIPARLQRQLSNCGQVATSVWHQLSKEQAVEILGPAGTYPLAVALNIIAVASGKPWGFIATPRTWSKEDWQKVEGAIATLSCLPLRYRTGFRKLGMEYWPTLGASYHDKGMSGLR